jgi:hypothetical protein
MFTSPTLSHSQTGKHTTDESRMTDSCTTSFRLPPARRNRNFKFFQYGEHFRSRFVSLQRSAFVDEVDFSTDRFA